MAIRKRSWATTTGETRESWIADYADQNGKRHQQGFKLRREAEEFISQAKVEVRAGTHTAASVSITVAAAADLWIKSSETRELERSTLAAYRQHVDLHIKPLIGRTKLSELTAPAVREFEDKLRRGDPAPGEERGAPRSPAMIRKILTSLSSILTDSFERGHVGRNVVRDMRSRRKRGVERRADKRAKGKLKVGVDIPTRDEIKAIVAALESHWRPLLLTAVFTGLRASELRGLRWSDVDLKKGQIHVRQRADRYNEIGAPKSAAGERTVPLPPIVVETLQGWKAVCPKSELDLVFPTSTGNIHHHTNIVKQGLIPAQIRAGVAVPAKDGKGKPIKDKEGRAVVAAKYTGLHALRHFYASWCINTQVDGGLGLPPKVVQERLGHSSITMTMDIYGHLFPRGDDGSELAAAQAALLG